MKQATLRKCTTGSIVWVQRFGRNLIALGFFLFLGANVASGQSYAWKSVAIKGGGFVTGIITHPSAPGVGYCRTDIGGAYRWDAPNNSWIPLLDFAADANSFGVESLALDPSDSNRVYIAASRNAPNGTPLKFLYASTNQGASFTSSTPPFELDGNVDGRSAGERMAVDPNSNNILFYGTREAGLYKSVNSGATWSSVASFPVTTTPNGVGLVFVEFIKNSGTPGSATPTIFVGVSLGGTNLFRSTDGGVTWTNVPTSTATNLLAHHAAQDGLGNLYVTFNDHPGPNSISTGRVHKFNLSTLAVSNVTPAIPGGAQGGFAGVSVDRQNPTHIVVSTMDRWWAPDPLPKWDTIYRSTNGGTSWTLIGPNSLPASTSAPWSVARSPHWAGDVEFDPHNSNRVFFVTGYGIIATTNFTAASVAWTFYNDGIEETVPLGLVSPPSGPFLMSAHGDIGAFRHYNLEVSPPLADYFNTHRGTSYGIDFAGNNPNRIVRLFNESPYGAYSGNGGTTWQDFQNIPGASAGNVAISADGNRIVWIPGASSAYYSTNNGVNWTAATGSPSGNLEPISDRVNSNKFYIYSGGTMYVSTDGGASFAAGGAVASGTRPRTVFGREGHLWVPRGNNGLSRSINSGASFTAVSSVQRVHFISFGMTAPGQTYPAIFIYGRVGGVDGIFRSDNEAVSWTRINDNAHQFGLTWIKAFCGDPRVYGRVYFGTEGRGIVYGELSSPPPAVPTNLTAVAGDARVALSWSAAATATNYFVKRSAVSGSGYTTIATNASVTFTNTGLSNGTLYYYVVSALNASGESGNSTEASARPVSLTPPQLGFNAAGNQLQLTWPLDHTGWQLQAQTNSLNSGLGVNWFTVSGSIATNQIFLPVNPANGAVFLRLISP